MFFPILFFTLAPKDQAHATRVIQLAVARDGTLRGSHYDLLSEEIASIQGSVDKQELEAAWTIGPSRIVLFSAPLDELTQPRGNVSVHLPTGEAIEWEAKRMAP